MQSEIFAHKKKIDVKDFQQYFARLMPDIESKYPQLTFDQIDNLSLLIQSSINEGLKQNKSKIPLPELDDIIEIFESVKETKKALRIFTTSMPNARGQRKYWK